MAIQFFIWVTIYVCKQKKGKYVRTLSMNILFATTTIVISEITGDVRMMMLGILVLFTPCVIEHAILILEGT